MQIVINTRRNTRSSHKSSPISIEVIVKKMFSRIERESHLSSFWDIDRTQDRACIEVLNGRTNVVRAEITSQEPDPVLALVHEARRSENNRSRIGRSGCRSDENGLRIG